MVKANTQLVAIDAVIDANTTVLTGIQTTLGGIVSATSFQMEAPDDDNMEGVTENTLSTIATVLTTFETT